MKRTGMLSLLLAVALAAALFAGCGGGRADLALITSEGSIDDASYNQGAWSGLVQYAEQKGISKKYIDPKTQDLDGYLAAIDEAVKDGAKVVVLPGYNFSEAMQTAQNTYPDVDFVLIDSILPADEVNDNAVAVCFAEEQAGFFAGYAAVADGYTKLGFIGGSSEEAAVVRYGYGFVQGAEYAANDMGLAAGSIDLRYSYVDGFEESDALQEKAAVMYQAGTEIIFTACGAGNKSVVAAADLLGTKVIGVDVDESMLSDCVITSATKGLSTEVYDEIENYYNGTFPGGQILTLTATDYGVGLAMDTARFRTFTQEQYDALFAKMMSNTYNIASDIIKDDQPLSDIPLSAVTLTTVE